MTGSMGEVAAYDTSESYLKSHLHIISFSALALRTFNWIFTKLLEAFVFLHFNQHSAVFTRMQ